MEGDAVNTLRIVRMYERLLAEAVERAEAAGFERGYRMGRLDGEMAEIKKRTEITPPSDRPPRDPRAET